MTNSAKQMEQPPPEGGGCLLQNDWLVQDDALSEWATIARLDIKLDRLTLDERLATLTLNLRVVNKDVRLAINSDETPALLVIEPLNGSYSHCGLLVSLEKASAYSGGNHNGNLRPKATCFGTRQQIFFIRVGCGFRR
jgi:hypothetical protein